MMLNGQIEKEIREKVNEKFSNKIQQLIKIIDANAINFDEHYKPNSTIYQINWNLKLKSSFSDFYIEGPFVKADRLDNFTNKEIANKIFCCLRNLNREIESYIKTLNGSEEFLYFNSIGNGVGITNLSPYTRNYNKENKRKSR